MIFPSKDPAISIKLLVALSIFFFMAGCDSDDPGRTEGKTDEEILEAGLIHEFSFKEVTPVSYEITQPLDGSDTGTIEVLLPFGTTDLMLTPEEAHFNTDDFTVSPDPGRAKNFRHKAVYILTSKEAPVLSIRYEVTVEVQDDPDDTGGEPDPDDDEADLSLARITAFDFAEAEPLQTIIKDPLLVDGAEKQPGTISILLPPRTASLSLTPLESNFGVKGFSISPVLGVQTDFSEPVEYTIQLNGTDKAVHYTVTVEVKPPGEPAVTAFRFEKKNNPELTEDIEAANFFSDADGNRIYVFVPNGTDFSVLHATVEYEGASLEYKQPDMTAYASYPDEGMVIDYTFPKFFTLRARNPDASVKEKEYEIIVEVVNPVEFSEDEKHIGNFDRGVSQSVNVTSVTNVGNYPIQVYTNIDTENKIPAGHEVLDIMHSDFADYPVIPSGESRVMVVEVATGNYEAGDYRATYVFKPQLAFSLDYYDVVTNWPEIDQFEASKVTVKITLK